MKDPHLAIDGTFAQNGRCFHMWKMFFPMYPGKLCGNVVWTSGRCFCQLKGASTNQKVMLPHVKDAFAKVMLPHGKDAFAKAMLPHVKDAFATYHHHHHHHH